MARHGVFPGSFDPLTVAHLAIADAARAQCGLTRLDLVISTVPLAKEHRRQAPVEERVRSIERIARNRPWLHARATDLRLVADIADGYDVLVLGADKWHQLHELRFYDGSEQARRAALARLPEVAVAPRRGVTTPGDASITVLDIDPRHQEVSSTAVRDGRDEWRASSERAEFGDRPDDDERATHHVVDGDGLEAP